MTALLKVAWLCGATALFVVWAGALFRTRIGGRATRRRVTTPRDPRTVRRLVLLTSALLALDLFGLAIWPAGPG